MDKAVATPGGLESISAALASGRGAGILSNNSSEAIVRYLKNTGLLGQITPVVGRKYARPDLMKPNTFPFHTALLGTERKAAETLYIGDSLSDIEVARAVGAPVVGFANKPGKAQLFVNAGASLIAEEMTEFADSLPANYFDSLLGRPSQLNNN